MAATFNTFRYPPQSSEFIPYNGPPKPKPTARRRNRNGRSSRSDEWSDVGKAPESTPEFKAASEQKEALTPTMRMAKICGKPSTVGLQTRKS